MGKLWENDDKSSHFMVDFDVYWCHKASCEKRPKMNNTVFPRTFTQRVDALDCIYSGLQWPFDRTGFVFHSSLFPHDSQESKMRGKRWTGLLS